MASSNHSVQKAPLHVPSLEEVAKVLENGLKENFEDVSVKVVDCPDLTKDPYHLSASGLCGNARLADVGGVPYLVPLVQREKIYNIEKVAEACELPGAFVVGAGAGPAHRVGVNSEMIANVKCQSQTSPTLNNTHLSKVNPQDGTFILQKSEWTDFCLLGNFYVSDGKAGKVLEVNAKRRTGSLNYMNCMRIALENHYGSKPVGIGGTFLIESGKVNIHVMPNFSTVPLTTEDSVNNWLNFYEVNTPLICLGTLISSDPDMDLRVEHFHCFSKHGDGGHYHYDTTPAEASYRGYFGLADYMFRIDRPKETHMVGRDLSDPK